MKAKRHSYMAPLAVAMISFLSGCVTMGENGNVRLGNMSEFTTASGAGYLAEDPLRGPRLKIGDGSEVALDLRDPAVVKTMNAPFGETVVLRHRTGECPVAYSIVSYDSGSYRGWKLRDCPVDPAFKAAPQGMLIEEPGGKTARNWLLEPDGTITGPITNAALQDWEAEKKREKLRADRSSSGSKRRTAQASGPEAATPVRRVERLERVDTTTPTRADGDLTTSGATPTVVFDGDI